MRTLIRLLQAYHMFIIFLALETFAFLMLINHNPYQKSKFTNAALSITGEILQKIEKVKNYFYLAKINQRLVHENAQLKNSLISSLKSNRITAKDLSDLVFEKHWTFIDCNIVFNSTNKQQNILIIDRGAKHGVVSEAGIVTEKGVIGIVRNVSANYSNALSLLNSQVTISARLRKSKHFGILKWDGRSPKYCYMFDLPTHINIENGDTIETSGYSSIFPAGIPIGIVEDFDKSNDPNFLKVKVKLLEEFGALSHAYIVINKFKNEIDSLKNLSQ